MSRPSLIIEEETAFDFLAANSYPDTSQLRKIERYFERNGFTLEKKVAGQHTWVKRLNKDPIFGTWQVRVIAVQLPETRPYWKLVVMAELTGTKWANNVYTSRIESATVGNYAEILKAAEAKAAELMQQGDDARKAKEKHAYDTRQHPASCLIDH